MAKHWADEYITKMRPITKAQTEAARKNAARFIFINDKQGNGVCQRCEREINVPKTKHLAKVKCPKCHKEMQIQHTWRMKKHLFTIDWLAIPQVLTDRTMVIRYVRGTSYGNNMIKAYEAARMFISEDHAEPEYYCGFNHADGFHWHLGKYPHFVHSFAFYTENKDFCMYANLYQPNKAMQEMNKLDCFKYYPVEKCYDNTRIVSQMHYLIKFARLNEKLEKVGMHELINENFVAYLHNSSTISFSKSKSSLIDMLRLDRVRYKWLKKNPNMATLRELQTIKQFNEYEYGEMVSLIPNPYDRGRAIHVAEDHHLNVLKTARYLQKHKVSYWIYERYLNRAKELGWLMDDEYYVYPKNFDTMNDKATAEITAKRDADRRAELIEKAKHEADKTAVIATISNVIRTAPELQDMFADAEHGLMIYVPESVADLYMSGIVMHNCLSTFAEPIVRKETLVFFIRRAEEPDKDYVAFEYYNGTVKQIYESHNNEVTDCNVIQFADRFVERLNEINIMKRIAA